MRKIFFIGIALIVLLFAYVFLAFFGVFDKKYSHEWLVRNFSAHEGSFSQVATLFEMDIRNEKNFDVQFGLSGGNRISLILYPTVIDPKNRTIGGQDLKFDSPKLDSALNELGWTNDILIRLKDALSKTNCDWIATTPAKDGSVSMFPKQNGWGSYSYFICKSPITDSLIPVYGKPLADTGFGKRVVVSYHSAL